MKLEASARTAGTSRALRSQGRIPAVVYNKSLNLTVDVELRAFDKVFRQQGTSSLIHLVVDGEQHDVLVREVQMDKRKRIPKHIDFYAITRGQKVQVAVPVILEGTSAGQRAGGQLYIQRREVTIDVLPSQIPHDVTVDITNLAIGDAVHVSDVAKLLPETADVVDDPALTIVTIVPPRVETATGEEGEGGEPEVIGRGGDFADAGNDEA
jgi:ribosomal protein L25, Ctc-form